METNLSEPKKKIYKKWWFWLIIIVILGIGAIGGSEDAPDENVPENLTVEQQFAKDNDISDTLSANLISASNSIGIDNISKLEAEGDGYTFTYEGYIFNVNVNNDESISGISSGTINFYENGEAVLNVNERLVTTTQKSQLITSAKNDVENRLKAPSTAKFPGVVMEADQWKINRNGDTFIISAWVDSQNSFGAMVRSSFLIQYEWTGDTETVPALADIIIE